MSEFNRVPFRTGRPSFDGGSGSPNGSGESEGFSPLRSQDALDAYCARVQQRLAEHFTRRKQFLHDAHERLARLMQTAHAVEDSALYHELWQHCLVTRELLQAMENSEPTRPSITADSPIFFNAEPAALLTDSAVVTTPAPLARPAGNGYASFAPTTAPVTRVPRRAMRPVAEIESDATALRAEFDEWAATHSLKNAAGELHIVNALRLRAIACRQRRLEAEAGDSTTPNVTELGAVIAALMDAADDQYYCVARDYEMEPRPTAYQWGELSERFQEMATAQAAFHWWRRHSGEVPVTEIQPLAESVAAIQQRFNRLLFRLGARDPFQQQLFDDLRIWAKEAQCYLHSLRPKVPIAELVDRSATLDPEWARLRMDHPSLPAEE